MKSLREQTIAKIEQGRHANPNFMKSVDDAINEAKKFQQGANAINIGQSAPNFELPDPLGKPYTLSNVLSQGPVIVTFYRGSWCPYCNLQLRALQSQLDEIHALGAKLVAISPEVPDGSLTNSEIRDMDFIVLSDQDAHVAELYGVSWEVPEVLLTHMKVDRQLDLETINNGNSSILPIPATFIINPEGIVTWRYVDVDYRTRSEPDDIINALKKLL